MNEPFAQLNFYLKKVHQSRNLTICKKKVDTDAQGHY